MKKIALIRGDGIGPEIVASAVKVIDAASRKFAYPVKYEEVAMGGAAYDRYGSPLPDEELNKALSSDAVLLGAVGGEKWNFLSGKLRPEAGLLAIRGAMKVYANLRPAKLYPQLKKRSPLSEKTVAEGFDVMFVRELTGGIYFGERGTRHGKLGREAFDTETYSEIEIERILRVAFELAAERKKRLVSVDKANVLETGRLWRTVLAEVAADYPEVAVDSLFVDNAAMQLVKDPSAFDVIVTSNMFGDILTDLAASLTGSIGLLPSASVGRSTLGLYEPIHGSAPDIAGKNIANPIGTVLSAAMMFRHSFGREDISACIETAVSNALSYGARTKDIADAGERYLSTDEMTDAIIANL